MGVVEAANTGQRPPAEELTAMPGAWAMAVRLADEVPELDEVYRLPTGIGEKYTADLVVGTVPCGPEA